MVRFDRLVLYKCLTVKLKAQDYLIDDYNQLSTQT